jgi:hypothetical protein
MGHLPVFLMQGRTFPPSTPSSTASWPDGSSTGPTKPFAVTQTGKLYDAASAVTGDAGYVGGAGTLADPYVIDSVHYTTGSVVGDFDPGTLNGKYVTWTNCWFQGDVGTGNLDALAMPLGIGINGRSGALPAFVTATDCLFAPAGSPVPAGGPDPATGGMGFVFFANNTPFRLTRCDLWGGAANIVVVNQGAGAARSFVEESWSHDQWVSGGAHTDNVNGADPTNASNVTFTHSVIDGKCGQRGPSFRVVNDFGIYNTQAITGWVIDRCLIENADFGLFWAGVGVGAAITDMTATNNVFDLSNLGTPLSGRTDILTQSGNTDLAGNLITL